MTLKWVDDHTKDGRYKLRSTPVGASGEEINLLYSATGGPPYTNIGRAQGPESAKKFAQVHADSRRPQIALKSWRIHRFPQRSDWVGVACPHCGQAMAVRSRPLLKRRGETASCFYCFKTSVIPGRKT